jgi:peptidoglycan/LPS O-acetylase OafA/YrhL
MMPLYVPALTGIRALAALLVLGLHADQNVPAGVTVILPFLSRGYLGVDFFFVLSGFIITHVYLRSMTPLTVSAVRIFLWHRLIRLYPVHITVLLALVVMISVANARHITINNPEDWRGASIPWHLALLHAWGLVARADWNAPSWSISAEWFAYLCFPFLASALIVVRDRLVSISIAAAALACTAAVFFIADWGLNTWVGIPALCRVLGEFLCGAALCRTIDLNSAARLWTTRETGCLTAGSDLLGAAAFLLFLIGASVGLPDFGLVALLALTIVGAAGADGLFARLLGSGPLVWLGEVSYSIYMVHFPVLLVMRRFWEWAGIGQWSASARGFAFAFTIAVVIVVAATMFYVIEHPTRTHLRDYLGKLRQSPVD